MLFEHTVDIEIDRERTALVLADIQNDFLTEGGKYYVLIEELLKRNNVNDNLETLLQTAKDNNFPVFMSPHYFFPARPPRLHPAWAPWKIWRSTAESSQRQSPLNFEGRSRLGRRRARSLPEVHGGQRHDHHLAPRQLRTDQRPGVTAAPAWYREGHHGRPRGEPVPGRPHAQPHPERLRNRHGARRRRRPQSNEEGAGYDAAMINWRFMANAVWTTEEVVRRVTAAAAT